MLKGLHHNAYRCRDSEETRKFYEDFLGLPLVNAFPIQETKTGRATSALHSFYQMDDGSCLAFFEVPDMPFEFRKQHDYDLHIAHAPGTTVAAFTTVPLAVFFLCVWYVQDCPGQTGLRKYLLPMGSAAVVAATFGPAPIHVTAGIAVVVVVLTRLVR